MRLFGYYALHSFINQIRKLLKTKVLLFLLICMLMGGLIGVGIGVLTDTADEASEYTEEDASDYDDGDEETPLLMAEMVELGGSELPTADLMELIAGVLILALFAFMIFNADRGGSRIFLPADVNLLFASPMKPQSVLLFRTTLKLGVALIATIYLAFQLPNLMLNLGLSGLGAAALMLTWFFAIAVAELLQILCYTVCSTRTGWKKYIHNGLYGLLGVLVLAYLAVWKVSGQQPLPAAVRLFNGRFSRMIPLWGWLKGLMMYTVEGNFTGAAICMVLLLAGGSGLVYLIWHLKADFYEDAMAGAEEVAELQEKANSEKSSGLVLTNRKKKDRSDRLTRDGMTRGWGAAVFFHKSLYNRFRFAHLRFFTKTMEFYLVLAAGVGLLLRLVLSVQNLIPVALALGVCVFYRALGNPLEQDTKMDFFRMIPEPAMKKLLWSLLGGMANTGLDLLPALLVGAVLVGASPLQVLVWLVILLSVDFYATAVSAFMGLALPAAADKLIKQFASVLFLYFGLLPDIALIAVGIVLDLFVPLTAAAVALNAGLGLLFLLLAARCVETKSGKAVDHTRLCRDLPAAGKNFSTIGWAILVIFAVTSLLQVGITAAAGAYFPSLTEQEWFTWVLTFAPLYLVGVPIGLRMLKKVPAVRIESKRLSLGSWLSLIPVAIAMMYAGSLLGNLVNAILSRLAGGSGSVAITSYALEGSLIWKVLIMVILGPVIEELIFRKTLIDRMRPYGEKTAVVTSALLFGLFHANLTQFVYASVLGLLFGYVYLKTGRLRYSTGLHMVVNFLGSVLSVAMLKHVDLEALNQLNPDSAALQDSAIIDALLTPGLIAFAVYVLCLLAVVLTGIVLFIVKVRSVSFDQTDQQLPRGRVLKTVWINAGMLTLTIVMVAVMAVMLAI